MEDEDADFWADYYLHNEFRALDEEDLALFEEILPVVHNEVQPAAAVQGDPGLEVGGRGRGRGTPLDGELGEVQRGRGGRRRVRGRGGRGGVGEAVEYFYLEADIGRGRGRRGRRGRGRGEVDGRGRGVAAPVDSEQPQGFEAATAEIQVAPNFRQDQNSQEPPPQLQAAPNFGPGLIIRKRAPRGPTKRAKKEESRLQPFQAQPESQFKAAAARMLTFLAVLMFGYLLGSHKQR